MRDVGPGYGSSAVVDRVAGVWDKLATVGVYEWDAFKRRASNPLQSLWDDLTLTTLIEQGAAIETIMVDDAEIYRGGDFCGAEVECLIGADTLLGYDATTIGHTLRFESHDAPEEGTAAHETQHAYDVESLGGVGFVIADVLGLASCLCYRESYWEQRAYRIGANGYPANGPPRGVLGQAWSAIWGSP